MHCNLAMALRSISEECTLSNHAAPPYPTQEPLNWAVLCPLPLSSMYCCPIVLFCFTQLSHSSLFEHPPVRSSWTSACSFQQKLLMLLQQYWLDDTGITLENERRHWKCLFSRLICSLIHLSSSTSSVLTCPPPKDPLHASSSAQPAPRRRLLLPLFFQSSSSLRDPSSSLTLIVLSLFTKAFYIKVDAAFSCSCLFLKPQTIIHILCRLAQCTLVSHLHNGLSPAYLRLLAQKCVILNTCPELTGVIIGLRLEPHDVLIEAQGMYPTAQYSGAGHSVP